MNHQIQIYQLKYIIRMHTRPALARICVYSDVVKKQ